MLNNNLINILQNANPKKGITYIKNKDHEEYITYSQLYQGALQVLKYYQDKGLTKNDKVIIFIDDTIEFLYSFWGCILGGIVAVPITVGDNILIREKVENVYNTLETSRIITNEKFAKTIKDIKSIDDKNTLCYKDIEFNDKVGVTANVSKEDIAFIQFSSGSTSEPKGVMLSHENLITNIDAIVLATKIQQNEKTISWLPLTHDMGLIGFHLSPLYASIDQIIMPAVLFARRPLLYLEKVAQHKASILSSPNFGLKHILDFLCIKKHFKVDLSHVRVLFNGAEPISYELCLNFIEAMKKYNMKENVIFPVYGMAEASLAIAFPDIEKKVEAVWLDRKHIKFGQKVKCVDAAYDNNICFVKVGYGVKNCEIVICNDNFEKLTDGTIGNICIRGKNVTRGYYNNDILTNSTISQNNWLNTGDLGFIYDSELVIVGRKKDIIFVNGQNIYPHDIELMVENMKNENIKGVIVCGVPNEYNKDEIVIFISSKYNVDQFLNVANNIRNYISNRIGNDIKSVIPVKRIPKTTSGKKQRYKMLQRLLNGEFDTYLSKFQRQEQFDEEINDVELVIKELFQNILKVDNISINKTFFELGGDSLKALYLLNKIEQIFHKKINIKDLSYNLSIKDLAFIIKNSKKKIEIERSGSEENKEYLDVLSSQKRLVILNQEEHTKPLFNLLKAYRLIGNINVSQLTYCIHKLIERHQSLRTSFVIKDENIYQKINHCRDFKIITKKVNDNIDLVAYIKTLNIEFNLTNDLLFKVFLIDYMGQMILVFCIHHIIVDGISFGILMKDIMKLYNDIELEEIGYNMYNFVSDRKFLMKSLVYEIDKEYWCNKLENDVQTINLPYDFDRPSYLKYEGNSIQFNIKNIRGAIKSFSKLNNTTEYITLFSAFNILLNKFTNQKEFIIGTPTSIRTGKMEKLVAMLTNTLPILVKIDTNISYSEYIQEFKKNIYEDISHNQYLVENLIDDMQLKPQSNRNALFDVVFNMQNMELPRFLLGDIKLDEMYISTNKTKVDLTLDILPCAEGYRLNVEYSTELFDKLTIHNIINRYINIIKKLIDNPNSLIRDIELINDIERNKILFDFNNIYQDVLFVSFKEAFEIQVNKHPGDIAIFCGDKSITYEELNNQANIIAHEINAVKTRDNENIALLMNRSIERGAVLIGCLKSGCAYIPIEHNYPKERIKYIIENSKVDILITDVVLDCNNYAYSGTVIYYSSFNRTEIYENPPYEIKPDNTAYIIYTSGTTGKPKGVMVSQHNLSAYIHAFCNEFPIDNEDKLVQQASYGFDAFIEEMYPILTVGGSVSIYKEEDIRDIGVFINKMKKEKVTMISASPLLLNEINKNAPDCHIHTYISGGDVLKWNYIDNIINKAQVYNTYGPTETTVCATYYKCNKNDKNRSIPIGRPITNYKVYILDEQRKVCPVGVIGELCIGGKGVTKGYFNNKRLTKEKFIYFKYNKSGKIYRTGDLASWLPDGKIKYIGRMDNQVNIRGYRIELGEIENYLMNIEGIKEVTVLAKKDQNDNDYICAYMIGKEMSIKSIRSYLYQYLPEYMIPSYFVFIDRIPLNSSGKINTRLLPEPDTYLNIIDEYIEPINNTERKVVEIIKELLNVNRVSMNDNFFELGGNSLKATILLSRLNKEFNLQITIRDIFSFTDIRQMSDHIMLRREVEQYIAIEPQVRKTYNPLSSAQKRIFALMQIDPDSTSYNITRAVKIQGYIDYSKIEQVFIQLIDRHESLRTIFYVHEGIPVQSVLEQVDFSLEYFHVIDKKKVDNLICEFIRPFDINKGPLIRVGLIHISDYNYILILDIHHIIADGVSISILMDEFMKLYTGRPLNEVTLQYLDYAIWQNKLLQSGKLEEKAKYWEKVFYDKWIPLDLPIDYQRPAMRTSEGSVIRRKIPEILYNQILVYANENDVTLYMVLLAAYKVLLYKYSQDNDIIVGTVSAGREHNEVESIVGMFVNTIPIRNYVDENKVFIDFLFDVKDKVIKAFENQQFPLEELVNRLDIPRDTSRNAIFDTMFALHNMYIPDMVMDNLIICPYEINNKSSMFDLTLEVIEIQEELICNFEYCTKLFDVKTIERLADSYSTILDSLINQPNIYIKDIPVMTETEKDRIVYNFNDTSSDVIDNRIILHTFEEQVVKTPNNIAIAMGSQQLTYYELNNKANQLAHILINKGVKANTLVGIMVKRSIYRVITLLAVWKAGGAYVPIEPTYPIERINYMIEDSNISIMIRNDNRQDVIFNGTSILVEKLLEDKAEYKNYQHTILNTDLAYVIYTSGTTGKPKGVMVEHRNVTNYLCAFLRTFNLTEEDIVLQQASYVFDTFIEELYPALCTGASIVLTMNDEVLDITRLKNLIHNKQITVISCSPLLVNEINRYAKELTSLRIIISGGDILKYSYINNLVNYVDVYNTYGPTETTVCATYYKVNKNIIYNNVPIGKPILNYKIYILDKHNDIVPIGVKGELCIAGVGVTRGYLNKPQLTRKKFVKIKMSNELVYKTGDVAKWLYDGNIEFLGRMDNQVNIRGYRVELGEIENQLMNYEGIEEAVAIYRQDVDDNNYIIAYITGLKDIEQKEIRAYLRKYLPNYMIPSFFVCIPKIPVNTNGKIDRVSLPEPNKILSKDNYEQPRNQVEISLVKSFEEVLNVKNIGIQHDFFELGGDSIKAIQLIAELKRYKLEATVKDVFLYSTIANLSHHVIPLNNTNEQGIITGNVLMTPIQYWFFEQNFIDKNCWNQYIVLESDQPIDIETMNKSFNILIKHHDALRIRCIKQDGQYNLHNTGIEDDKFVLKVYESNKSNYNDVQNYIKEKCEIHHKNICIEDGTMLVAVLFKTPKKDFLFIAIHHLVVDGISWRILLEDLFDVYLKISNTESVKLQNKTMSFKRWSEKLLEYANKGNLIKELDYWVKIEKQCNYELPNLNQTIKSKIKNIRIAKEELSVKETNKLLREVNKTYNTTTQDILLTALGLTLQEWTGYNQFKIALEGHGRENIIDNVDITRTVGWFTSVYPIVLSMTKYQDIPYNIKSIKDSIRKIPHHGIGYGILRYITYNGLDINPLTQNIEVAFNYLGEFGGTKQAEVLGITLKDAGLYMSKQEDLQYVLDINCGINEGKLSISFAYSELRYPDQQIERLLSRYKEWVLVLIDHCTHNDDYYLTPSDLTIEDLTIEELEDLTVAVSELIDE